MLFSSRLISLLLSSFARSTVGIPTVSVLSGVNITQHLDFASWACPTVAGSNIEFATVGIPVDVVTAFNSMALTNVYEFNDNSNDVIFVPPGPNTNVLSVAPFQDIQWTTPALSPDGSIFNFTGSSDMMDVSLLLNLQASSGRESALPKNAFPDWASTVTLIVSNYKYNNTQWIGKLAIEAYLPSSQVWAWNERLKRPFALPWCCFVRLLHSLSRSASSTRTMSRWTTRTAWTTSTCLRSS